MELEEAREVVISQLFSVKGGMEGEEWVEWMPCIVKVAMVDYVIRTYRLHMMCILGIVILTRCDLRWMGPPVNQVQQRTLYNDVGERGWFPLDVNAVLANCKNWCDKGETSASGTNGHNSQVKRGSSSTLCCGGQLGGPLSRRCA